MRAYRRLKRRQAQGDEQHIDHVETDIRYLPVPERPRKVAEYCRRNGYDVVFPVFFLFHRVIGWYALPAVRLLTIAGWLLCAAFGR